MKFGEVVERVVERVTPRTLPEFERFVGVDHLEADTLAIRRSGRMANDDCPPTFKFIFRSGAVLFPTRRPALRKAGIVSFDGITGEKLLVLRAKAGAGLTQRFLGHLVFSEHVRQWVVAKAIGSVTPHFRWGDLAECPLVLPSEDEQARIGSLFDVLQENHSAYRELAEAAAHVTSRAFEGLAKTDWTRVRVSELLTEPPRNGVSPNCNSDALGYPTLPVGCVYSGVVDTTDNLKFAELDATTYHRFKLNPGEVLVVRGNGNRALVGRAGLVVDNSTGCFFPDLLVRLRFDRAKLSAEYANIAWNSVVFHAELISRAKSTNGIFKINGTDLQEHSLPVPSQREQQALVEGFSQIKRAQVAAEARAMRSYQLLRSAMTELFEQFQPPAVS